MVIDGHERRVAERITAALMTAWERIPAIHSFEIGPAELLYDAAAKARFSMRVRDHIEDPRRGRGLNGRAVTELGDIFESYGLPRPLDDFTNAWHIDSVPVYDKGNWRVITFTQIDNIELKEETWA